MSGSNGYSRRDGESDRSNYRSARSRSPQPRRLSPRRASPPPPPRRSSSSWYASERSRSPPSRRTSGQDQSRHYDRERERERDRDRRGSRDYGRDYDQDKNRAKPYESASSAKSDRDWERDRDREKPRERADRSDHGSVDNIDTSMPAKIAGPKPTGPKRVSTGLDETKPNAPHCNTKATDDSATNVLTHAYRHFVYTLQADNLLDHAKRRRTALTNMGISRSHPDFATYEADIAGYDKTIQPDVERFRNKSKEAAAAFEKSLYTYVTSRNGSAQGVDILKSEMDELKEKLVSVPSPTTIGTLSTYSYTEAKIEAQVKADLESKIDDMKEEMMKELRANMAQQAAWKKEFEDKHAADIKELKDRHAADKTELELKLKQAHDNIKLLQPLQGLPKQVEGCEKRLAHQKTVNQAVQASIDALTAGIEELTTSLDSVKATNLASSVSQASLDSLEARISETEQHLAKLSEDANAQNAASQKQVIEELSESLLSHKQTVQNMNVRVETLESLPRATSAAPVVNLAPIATKLVTLEDGLDDQGRQLRRLGEEIENVKAGRENLRNAMGTLFNSLKDQVQDVRSNQNPRVDPKELHDTIDKMAQLQHDLGILRDSMTFRMDMMNDRLNNANTKPIWDMAVEAAAHHAVGIDHRIAHLEQTLKRFQTPHQTPHQDHNGLPNKRRRLDGNGATAAHLGSGPPVSA